MKTRTAAALVAASLLSGCSLLPASVWQNIASKAEGALYEVLKNRAGQIEVIVTGKVNEDAVEATATMHNVHMGLVAASVAQAKEVEDIRDETLNLTDYQVAWVVEDDLAGAQLFICDVRRVPYCGRMRAGDRYNLEAADIHPDRICLSTESGPDARRCFESFYNVRKLHPPRGKR